MRIAISLLFLVSGVAHFASPRFFLAITPKWVPWPAKVNLLVGAIEIALALLLWFEPLAQLAAWALIALLVAVFPANLYHFQRAQAKQRHVTAAALRLPFQAIFIYCVYQLT